MEPARFALTCPASPLFLPLSAVCGLGALWGAVGESAASEVLTAEAVETGPARVCGGAPM